MTATLSESVLAACSPVQGEGGNVIRAFCPFHSSDHQRSLRVDLVTGRFKCFACGLWGHLDGQQWRRQRGPTRAQVARAAYFGMKVRTPAGVALARPLPEPEPLPPSILAEYQEYCEALPGSLAEQYLAQRGIPLDLALRYGVGYARMGSWAHRDRNGKHIRQWITGHVVFPETDPQGRIVNLYARVVGSAPRDYRHDHLPRPKGWFNTPVINTAGGRLYITEGVFDALSLIAAGQWRTLAIIGVGGIRWNWLEPAHQLVIAFDADETGQPRAQELLQAAILRGKTAKVLPPTAYNGEKDPSAAWAGGVLDTGEWA